MYLTNKKVLYKVTIVTGGLLILYGLCHYTALRQRVFMTSLAMPMSPMTCYQCNISNSPGSIQTIPHTTVNTQTGYKVPNRNDQNKNSTFLDKVKPRTLPWTERTIDGTMNVSGYNSSNIGTSTKIKENFKGLPFDKTAYDIMSVVCACTFFCSVIFVSCDPSMSYLLNLQHKNCTARN